MADPAGFLQAYMEVVGRPTATARPWRWGGETGPSSRPPRGGRAGDRSASTSPETRAHSFIRYIDRDRTCVHPVLVGFLIGSLLGERALFLVFFSLDFFSCFSLYFIFIFLLLFWNIYNKFFEHLFLQK